MHEQIQDVITVHQAQNFKPHAPNMFPTTGIARLNWGLEEWPRSARCMKMDEVRGTGYLASPVRNHPMTWGFCIDSRNKTCQKMSKHITCRSGLRCLFYNCNLWSFTKLKVFWSNFWDGRTYALRAAPAH